MPFDELRLTPGTAVPRDGVVVPSDAPGFGLELSLEGLRAMAV